MPLHNYLPDSLRSTYSLKLFVVSSAVVLLIVGVGVLTVLQVSDRVTEEQLASIEANAELEAQTLGQWIEGEQASVRLLSNHQGLAAVDSGTARATLEEELGEMPPETAHLSLVERTPDSFSNGTDETIVASTESSFEGEPLSVTNIDWNPTTGYNFDDEDDVILSWVYIDGTEPSVAIASPTPDGEHVLVATYRTNVRAEQFTSVVGGTDTLVLGGFTAFVLFDDNKSNVMTRYKGDRENTTVGSLILDTDPFETLNGSVLTADEVKGYHSVPGDDVDWVVVKEAPRSTALALTTDVRRDLAVLVLLTILGFLLIGAVIQHGPLRAIQRVAAQADAISEGNLSVDIEAEGRIDEIGQVRDAFRNTKAYVETITKQSEALSRQEFDADVLEEDIPGRVGEAMATMRTDLERFIDEIEAERRRYSTLVEQSSDGIAVVQGGQYVFVNDRFVGITGYNRETLFGMDFEELILPEDRQFVRERYDRLIGGDGSPERYEVGMETRQGERRTLDIAVSRIEHDGEPAVLANVRDITERTRRKRAIRSLQEATERMQTAETPERVAEAAVEAASDVLELPMAICWFHDEETRRLEPVAATDRVHEAGLVSPLPPDRYEYRVFQDGDVTSYTPSDESTENPLNVGVLLPLGDHGLIAAGRQEGVAADDVVLDAASALAEHTATALDRVERAAAVRESEQRFRLIAERIDEVIYLATLDFSEMLYVNPAYEEIWGRPVEELYHDTGTFLEGIDPRDRERVEADFEAMLADMERGDSGDSYTLEYRVRQPDGAVRWVHWSGYAVELPGDERRLVGVIEDITERKQREQRLEVFNRVLRHNLRNELDVIKSHAEVLADEDGNPHPQRILAATDRLAGIGNRARRIDQFMAREVADETVDLADLLRSTLESVQQPSSDITVTADLPPTAPVVTDEEILRAVLEAPLENAVAYAEAAVDVRLVERADGYAVVIEDDGPGIPPAELASLDAGTETPLQHGRGLGLWQLKWAVDQLNGDLTFDVSGGTTVRITVPDRGEQERG